MASLIEFHKWYSSKRYDDSPIGNVGSYRRYLEEELHMPCKDNGTFSHWGPNAHKCEWRIDSADMAMLKAQSVKVKKPSINQWLLKHYPNILKEFKENPSLTPRQIAKVEKPMLVKIHQVMKVKKVDQVLTQILG